MSVVCYRDPDYAGPSLRLSPGFYFGERQLRGTVARSSYDESLDDAITSIRVPARYIVVLYPAGGYSASGARAIIGPQDIPDLTAIGINDKTSAIRVVMYEAASSAVPRDFGVNLYWSQTPGGVPQAVLGQGDYDQTRLNSDEVGAGDFRSLCARSNTIAVLYEKPAFEPDSNSTVLLPGECVSVERLDMSSIQSIRVLFTEEPPKPGAPTWAAGPSPLEAAAAQLGRLSIVHSFPRRNMHFASPVDDLGKQPPIVHSSRPIPAQSAATPAQSAASLLSRPMLFGAAALLAAAIPTATLLRHPSLAYAAAGQLALVLLVIALLPGINGAMQKYSPPVQEARSVPSAPAGTQRLSRSHYAE